MLSAAVWLMLSSMLTSLRISGGGSFPKPLTAEEERIYLKRSAEGDLEARNILIERNLRLVAHIMKKYYSQSADQEDLISIGTIGLIKGISTFDASKGARLATYAARCVENAILSQRNKRQLRWRNRRLLRENGACWREWESATIFCFPMYRVR
jgi:RNA polymerase sporulation-specific sigma factor